jgi:hypothetical protein
MPVNTLPVDSASRPADGLFDPTTGHVIAAKSGTVATSGGGVEYAPAIVNIADPTTPANQLAVNSLGQIAISNFPSVQSVIGTVSIAQFPSVQTVSGSVDVSDRTVRQLGHVIVDLGGAGTNTAPGYSVIQDGTLNTRKMAVNADGSINVSGTISASNPSVSTTGAAVPTSSTLVGASDGVNLQQLLVESSSNRNLRVGLYSGANEATITGANALKVDGSGITQPVSGTITANAGTGNFTVAQATGSNLHAVLDAGSAVIGHVIADSGSTTAATQATAANLNAQVVGPAASGASNSGNPVKIGGPFNTTQPTVTNGQTVDAQLTARGAQIVATGTDAFSVSANAGTNLNTSLLALEGGGNLATLAGAVTSSKVQENVAQINGVTPLMGNGVSGTGAQRVTLASDSTGQVALAAGSALVGTVEIADSAGTNKLAIDASGRLTLVPNQSINNAQIAGTTMSVNQGTADNGTQRVINAGAATGTKSSVASSASSVTILASNTSRKGAMVYNDSTQILYLDLSGGTASAISYSVQVPANGFFELPAPVIYNGAITGIWAAANGSARVTELS